MAERSIHKTRKLVPPPSPHKPPHLNLIHFNKTCIRKHTLTIMTQMFFIQISAVVHEKRVFKNTLSCNVTTAGPAPKTKHSFFWHLDELSSKLHWNLLKYPAKTVRTENSLNADYCVQTLPHNTVLFFCRAFQEPLCSQKNVSLKLFVFFNILLLADPKQHPTPALPLMSRPTFRQQ